MTNRSSGDVLRQIHTLFTAGSLNGLSDRQLLNRFVARRDAVAESAFTILVERHGPMVLGVCRRVLVDAHDAEDAFQATFLVLVRRAGSIRVEGSLGRWLYGVATRVAKRARASARHREARERPELDRMDPESPDTSAKMAELVDIRSILAEEMGKLPYPFQAAVVLCDIEGSSHEEAARLLGWPVGTVKSRLARARARLRAGLIRRHIAPSDLSNFMPFFATHLTRRLVDSTSRAAYGWIPGRLSTPQIISASVAALTEGVLKTMFLTRLNVGAAVFLLILTGSAVAVNRAIAQKPVASSGIDVGRAERSRMASHDDEVDLAMLERAWADAVQRRDEAVISHILADDFEGIEPLGNAFSKTDYLANLRGGGLSAKAIVLDEIKARVFGDFAVVTSRSAIRNFVLVGRMSHVYARRQGRWLCVAAHGSSGESTGMPAGGLPPQLVGVFDDMNDLTNKKGWSNQRRLYASRPGVTLRPPFECRVEKIHVQLGKLVSKGDPVAELYSLELGRDKNEYRSKAARWRNDRHVLRSRQKPVTSDADSQRLLVDAQVNESRSLLEFQIAQSKLAAWGLDNEAIKGAEDESGEQLARMTLRSPAGGLIIEISAKTGDLCDSKSKLILIVPPSVLGPVFTR